MNYQSDVIDNPNLRDQEYVYSNDSCLTQFLQNARWWKDVQLNQTANEVSQAQTFTWRMSISDSLSLCTLASMWSARVRVCERAEFWPSLGPPLSTTMATSLVAVLTLQPISGYKLARPPSRGSNTRGILLDTLRQASSYTRPLVLHIYQVSVSFFGSLNKIFFPSAKSARRLLEERALVNSS